MIEVPGHWLAVADGTHAPRWRVTLLPATGDPVSGAVTSGSITRTLLGWPRTRVRVEVPVIGVPGLAPQHYLPYGSQMQVEFSADGGDFVTVARVHTIRSEVRRPDGVLVLEAVDASGLIQEDAMVGPRPAPPLQGRTVADCVRDLIRRTIPDAVVDVSGASVSTVVPADWDPDPSPWRCVEQLTDLAGATVDVGAGHPWSMRVRDMPALGVPVDRVAVAVTVTGCSVGWERTWNAVAVEFRDPDDRDRVSVTGWWVDERPDNPLAPSRLGHHITLVRDGGDGTPSQIAADAAAEMHGQRLAGRCRIVAAECVARPWLMPGDTIAMTFAGGPVDEAHLITEVTIPLDGAPMRITTDNARYNEGT